MLVWVTCCRCSGKLLYWAGGQKLQETWCQPHTDTDRYTATETLSFPLGQLGSPSETEREVRKDGERTKDAVNYWMRKNKRETSSVSNMVRLDENGELFFSLSSQGFSRDMEARPRSVLRPSHAPLLSEPAPSFTRTWILQTTSKHIFKRVFWNFWGFF